ncbi:MAG: 4a-hydroxytetrahydrobiopterin dehydratase, partial [Rhodothermales bacterium]|nr:4a-hydroxytetrahydrobiopterin dehydratase [Rhodothermales bacterium]
MPDVSPLSDAALAEAVAALSNWERHGDALVRTVELDDFPAAMAFLVRV